MRRKMMSKKSNRKNFKQGSKSHPKNMPRPLSRGGIRL